MASGGMVADRGGFIRPVGRSRGLLANQPGSSIFAQHGRFLGFWPRLPRLNHSVTCSNHSAITRQSLGNHSAITGPAPCSARARSIARGGLGLPTLIQTRLDRPPPTARPTRLASPPLTVECGQARPFMTPPSPGTLSSFSSFGRCCPPPAPLSCPRHRALLFATSVPPPPPLPFRRPLRSGYGEWWQAPHRTRARRTNH